MKKLELGATAHDVITGFTGVIMAHVRYLTGCDQYLLKPRCGNDQSKYPEGQWLDENRVIVEDAPLVKLETSPVLNGACEAAPKI